MKRNTTTPGAEAGSTSSATVDARQATADTVRWIERAVIGLNLCPFAKAVHAKRQIHYAVHLAADDDAGLIDELLAQAAVLVAMPASERDTTLVVAPNALADFLDFNDLVARADRRLNKAGFDGTLQLASFHPRFQFAGSNADEIANATNRAPHPTLHLLREESVDRAVEAFPDADAIFGRNIERLEALGADGWAALDVGPGATIR